MTTLKHRWSLGHNHLAGLTAGAWWQMLREIGFDLDWAYAHRAAFVTALSLNNSLWATLEERRYGEQVRQTAVTDAPVFVIGHWRSGTTHLHNLLCLDDQFCYPNTYQTVNPFTFLTTEHLNARLFGWLLPETRPMDNMRLTFASPQEDELALSMICRRSLYMGISFPRLESHYARYLSFRQAEPEARQAFLDALEWLVKKLTFKYQRPVMLKSPGHTARIAMLLSRWPQARFIHIHRDPYTVFRSSQRYFDTATWYTYMQKPDRDTVDEQILQRYVELYGAFFEQRPLIPARQFAELAFEELEAEPVATLERIYERLQLTGFETLRPKLECAAAQAADYRKNRYDPLPEDLRRQVRNRWHRGFDEWGYPT